MADQSRPEPHAHWWEDQLSGIGFTLATMEFNQTNNDITLFTGDISSGVTQSGLSQNLARFSKSTLYIDVTSTTVNTQSTGLTLFAYSRSTSTLPWILFLTNSNLASAGYMFNLVGSGGASSGVNYFRHVLIDLQNVSDSGTALVNMGLISLGK